MGYPTISNKYEAHPITTAKTFLEQLQPVSVRDLRNKGLIPYIVILIYDRSLLRYLVNSFGGKRHELFLGDFYLLSKFQGVGVSGNFGIGGPAVANIIELYAAIGVRNFISLGFAGAISDQLSPGSLIIPDSAVPDDGVSQHYQKSAQKIDNLCDIPAVERTISNLEEVYQGRVWSTAAIFRETQKEVEYFKEQGVLAVDMETASIFSISNVLELNTAVILSISDQVTSNGWEVNQKSINKATDVLTAFVDSYLPDIISNIISVNH